MRVRGASLFFVTAATLYALLGVFHVSRALAAAAGDEASSGVLEEVVVTARHREELVQDIPLSVTAFTAEDLRQRGVVDLRDIAALTPGFSFQNGNGGGNTVPVIRGASQVVLTLEQNVSFFLDGVYLPRDYLTNLGFDLLERVEVVEGPQSARYGRNAFMGAVNYVSRRPSEEFTAEAVGTVGNHNSYTGTAFASGAVIPGVLRLFGGVDYKETDGTWPNLAPYCNISFSTGTKCELGGYEHATYNLQAELLINDRLTADVSYYRFRFTDEAQPQNWFAELNANSQQLNCGQYNPNVRPASGGGFGAGGQWYRLYCGPIPVASVPQDPRGYAQQLTSDFYRGSINWKLNDAITVTEVASYISAENTSLDYKDNPGCPFLIPGLCIFEDGPLGNSRQTYDELRLNFDNRGPITAAFGVDYTYLYDQTEYNFVGLPLLTAVPTAPVSILNPASFPLYAVLGTTLTKDTIWSPFGELNYTFFDSKAHLGVEARYQSEKKTDTAEPTLGVSGLAAQGLVTLTGSFHSFTPRYTADYHLTHDTMLYASAAKGEHAGGFNETAYLASNRTYGTGSELDPRSRQQEHLPRESRPG